MIEGINGYRESGGGREAENNLMYPKKEGVKTIHREWITRTFKPW